MASSGNNNNNDLEEARSSYHFNGTINNNNNTNIINNNNTNIINNNNNINSNNINTNDNNINTNNHNINTNYNPNGASVVTPAPTGSSSVVGAEQQEWKFCQVFDRNPISTELSDADVVSAVEFNDTGEFIATGDRGGRVVIFQRRPETDRAVHKDAKPEYRCFAEFQSHELEFDYLKSIEIEEKINKIKWVNRNSDGLALLSTNDKTIKLWKVREKRLKHVFARNLSNGSIPPGGPPPPISTLKVPSLQLRESVVTATPRKIYANAHTYHVNSIAINSDQETFLSADDLRINLWKFTVPDLSFNIVDIKPANMEELSEVITCAEFHPNHCNLFLHSSSKGTIKLADMRSAALCDRPARVFEEPEDLATKSYFSDIISSISDIKFSPDGRYILARDYINIKLWDLNMESKPVKTFPVHDYLRPKLCDMYENDWIFDRFECAMSGDGRQIVAGSYHNYFHVYDVDGKGDTTIEASKYRRKNSITHKLKFRGGKKDGKKDDINPEAVEYTKKALHVAWHPREALVAIGSASNLFLYYA